MTDDLINFKRMHLIRPHDKDRTSESYFYKYLKKIVRRSSKYKVLMGIDFEFNTKKIALMQISFETYKPSVDKSLSRYFIIYPPELSNKTVNFLKDNILSNSKILKILHGSESLDLPYIVDELYNNDMEGLIDFFLSMIDTKYLCEYLNDVYNRQKVCRIYDMLLNYEIIDQRIYQILDKNEDEMGPIYKIIIDINNLSEALKKYSIYDVIYLGKAFLTLKDMIIKYNPKNYYLLIDILRFSFMEKRDITNIGDDLVVINMMNNYFILVGLKKTYKLKLIDVYNQIIKNYMESYPSIKPLIEITYFKKNMLNLFKTIIYTILLDKYTIYSSSTETISYNINKNYKAIINTIESLELNHLLDITKQFHQFTIQNIKINQ
jgi:hypothetical protein